MVKSRFHWTRQGSLVGSTCESHEREVPCILPVMPYLSRLLVYAGQVNLRHKSYLGGHIRILVATVNFEAINSVFVHTL